jgi:hypothetical protein
MDSMDSNTVDLGLWIPLHLARIEMSPFGPSLGRADPTIAVEKTGAVERNRYRRSSHMMLHAVPFYQLEAE